MSRHGAPDRAASNVAARRVTDKLADSHERTTPITVRRSSINISRGPIYAELARELAKRLYALRLSAPDVDSRILAGIVARDCDRMADAFDWWSKRLPPPSPDEIHEAVVEWQDVKSRARNLGLEVL